MKLWVTPVVLVTTYTEHTRSRNMEATFRGNHKTTVYTNFNGYYIY
jgi:hypothetical protein